MGLEDSCGIWQDEVEEVKKICTHHFTKIFSSIHPSEGDHSWVLATVEKMISDKDNGHLLLPFFQIEIRGALFQMHMNKSQRLDGFSPHFFNAIRRLLVSQLLIFALMFLIITMTCLVLIIL